MGGLLRFAIHASLPFLGSFVAFSCSVLDGRLAFDNLLHLGQDVTPVCEDGERSVLLHTVFYKV